MAMFALLHANAMTMHTRSSIGRAASLEVKLERLGAGPLHLAVDSTGVKLYGEGEWKVLASCTGVTEA